MFTAELDNMLVDYPNSVLPRTRRPFSVSLQTKNDFHANKLVSHKLLLFILKNNLNPLSTWYFDTYFFISTIFSVKVFLPYFSVSNNSRIWHASWTPLFQLYTLHICDELFQDELDSCVSYNFLPLWNIGALIVSMLIILLLFSVQ